MLDTVAKRRPYRTLEGWAHGILLEAEAIHECDDHGYVKERPACPRARLGNSR